MTVNPAACCISAKRSKPKMVSGSDFPGCPEAAQPTKIFLERTWFCWTIPGITNWLSIRARTRWLSLYSSKLKRSKSIIPSSEPGVNWLHITPETELSGIRFDLVPADSIKMQGIPFSTSTLPEMIRRILLLGIKLVSRSEIDFPSKFSLLSFI